ncbi:Disulfide bond formation protein D [Streptomyces hundungensis]|uniref:Disulfide bond formation protein D n=1 Tax=Streptomyces hundungensis TaxID=1077946 RepID=A0A387HLA4_9ACTN|nr:thioredoxin domain-containing protein [Streptomyces hundungensis]AYG81568.1 Disulfide bond formation protein D [Streptomyces hundungensis]
MSRPKTQSKQTARKPAKSRKQPYLIGAAVLVVAGVLGMASYQVSAPDPRPAVDGSGAAAASDPAPADAHPELTGLARRDAKDPLAQGRADAPVVMIEYADFKCSYCGKFARDTEPELVKKYVDDGTLRIEWRNFPIFGAESEAAARGAWAAGQQGRFWQFHAAAYARDAKEKGFGGDRLKELAKEAGVPDAARFAADLDGEAAKAAVKKDQDEAYALGASSTPSFLINGTPLAGAQPMDSFAQVIDAAARTAKK